MWPVTSWAAASPEWYTDEFHRVSDRAQVRRIRLHESRHTACSLMERAGVPVIAAWAGHYTGAFTMSQCVHANPDDLADGRDALAAIYRAEDALWAGDVCLAIRPCQRSPACRQHERGWG